MAANRDDRMMVAGQEGDSSECKDKLGHMWQMEWLAEYRSCELKKVAIENRQIRSSPVTTRPSSNAHLLSP